jgi:hypothetical protein
MSYSLDALQTVADCDAMLSMANSAKGALEAKQVELNNMRVRYGANAVEVSAELPAAEVELASKVAGAPALPEGPSKKRYMHEMRRLESRVYLLTTKGEKFGSFAEIEKQWEIARVARELTETDAYIAAIEAKKATL